MLHDEGAAFRKAISEHNSRKTHTIKVIELLWCEDKFEVVPVTEMQVSTVCSAVCRLLSVCVSGLCVFDLLLLLSASCMPLP